MQDVLQAAVDPTVRVRDDYDLDAFREDLKFDYATYCGTNRVKFRCEGIEEVAAILGVPL